MPDYLVPYLRYVLYGQFGTQDQESTPALQLWVIEDLLERFSAEDWNRTIQAIDLALVTTDVDFNAIVPSDMSRAETLKLLHRSRPKIIGRLSDNPETTIRSNRRIVEELLRLGLLPEEELHREECRGLIRQWHRKAVLEVRAREITADEGSRRLLTHLETHVNRMASRGSSARAAWKAVDREALAAFVEAIVIATSESHE